MLKGHRWNDAGIYRRDAYLTMMVQVTESKELCLRRFLEFPPLPWTWKQFGEEKYCEVAVELGFFNGKLGRRTSGLHWIRSRSSTKSKPIIRLSSAGKPLQRSKRMAATAKSYDSTKSSRLAISGLTSASLLRVLA